MEKNVHDIEYERKFVRLFGYHLIDTSNPNFWIIADKKNNSVGSVEFKLLYDENPELRHGKIYGYQTIIHSPLLTCDSKRELTDGYGHEEHNAHFSFDYNIKGDDHDHADVSMGDFPGVTVWSKEHGFISFDIAPDRIYLNYKSRTEHFNIEEILVFKNRVTDHREAQEYAYQLRSCTKDYELVDDKPLGRTTREIEGIHSYYDEDRKLKVTERTWVNGNLRHKRESFVDGTVEEMAKKQEMGIDCFNHFRVFIKKVLPIKRDLISTIVTDDLIEEGNFQVFFPDYQNRKTSGQK